MVYTFIHLLVYFWYDIKEFERREIEKERDFCNTPLPFVQLPFYMWGLGT